MAERNYTITLKNESSGESSGTPVAGQTQQAKAPANGNAAAKGVVKGLVAYNTYVKPFVSQIVSQQINTISLRTGASEQQQRIQFAYEVAQQAAGIGASILTGFAIGNVPGAIAGAVVGVASTALNYANKAQTIQLESDLENISIRGLTVRSGGYAPSYSGSRSGTQ